MELNNYWTYLLDQHSAMENTWCVSHKSNDKDVCVSYKVRKNKYNHKLSDSVIMFHLYVTF